MATSLSPSTVEPANDNCLVVDGQLADDDKEELRQIFAIFDHDFDGLIPLCELTTVLKSMGINPNDKDIVDTAGSIDSGAGSSINFDGFLKVIVSYRQQTSDVQDAEFREAFTLFDRDADGYLTNKDFKQAMLNLGEKMTDEELDEMVRLADTNKDGRISYKEFYKMMTTL